MVPFTKGQWMEFWCFLWCLPEQDVQQIVELQINFYPCCVTIMILWDWTIKKLNKQKVTHETRCFPPITYHLLAMPMKLSWIFPGADWKSMRLPEISRVTWQVCSSVMGTTKPTQAALHCNDVIMSVMASQLFTQPLIQAQIKENIKALHHWPLYGEFTGEFPTQRASNTEMFPFDDVIMAFQQVQSHPTVASI